MPKRQQVVFKQGNSPADQLLLRSVLCDKAKPDAHLPGFEQVLLDVAQAAGAGSVAELRLSLDRTCLEVETPHSLFYMILDYACRNSDAGDAGGDFDVDDKLRPVL